jgi:CBS domain-containing protein
MLKAKDIMTRHVVTVKSNTPIYEAIEMLVKNDISGMPVVDDDMTLVGMLSEKDATVLFYGDGFQDDRTVEDYMAKPVMHFDENDSLSDVSDFLMKNIFRRVPVTANGKLVGIISVRDVLKYALEQRQNRITAHKNS